MPARTKGRARFDFQSRPFVWWIDGDRWLRIASDDKQFVVAYPLGRAPDQPAVLVVHGHEFPGLEQSARRPINLRVFEPSGDSIGAWVQALLQWCFDPTHELIEIADPPRFS